MHNEATNPGIDQTAEQAAPLALILAVPYPPKDDTYTGITVPTRVAPNEIADD